MVIYTRTNTRSENNLYGNRVNYLIMLLRLQFHIVKVLDNLCSLGFFITLNLGFMNKITHWYSP